MKIYNKKRGNMWITVKLDNNDLKNGINYFIEYAKKIIDKVEKENIDKEYKVILLNKLIPTLNDILNDIAENKVDEYINANNK